MQSNARILEIGIMIQILEIFNGDKLEEIRSLFNEYAASLEISLDFQDFDDEFATLPGRYAPPEGCLLLALWKQRTAGCVALRKSGEEICEMKRLYVRPHFRGLKIGRALSEALIQKARDKGYTRMRLDTLSSMNAARALYVSLGFHEIAPYYHNPAEDPVFMELLLFPQSIF